MSFLVRNSLWLSQLSLASLMVAGREALLTLPPGLILLARLLGGAALFALLATREQPRPLAREHRAKFLVCAVLGAVLNQVFFLYGLQRTTATHASVLSASIPLLTLVFAVAGGREALTARKLVGVLFGLCGAVALILSGRAGTAGPASLAGDLLIAANCCCWAAFLILVRDLAQAYGPMLLASRLFLAGSVLALPFCLGPALAYLPALTAGEAGYLAFIVCVPTVGAYAFNQIAIRHHEASRVAIHWYLLPVFGVIGAAARLGEPIEPPVLAFAALICLGILTGTAKAGRGASA